MSTALPIHNYPRQQQYFAPTSHPQYTAGSTSYYPTSSSSYWSTGPPSSSSTTSSSCSPSKLSVGIVAARQVTKATGHFRKRSKSSKSDDEDDMVDEGFFSGPSPPVLSTTSVEAFHHSTKSSSRTKNKIKPLLQKVSGSRGNSLDLSRSDGGLPNGVGLGIYDGNGYDSSGMDDDLGYGHRRAISTASGQSPLLITSHPTQPFSHPKRQVPRRSYTPEISYNGTSNESSDDSSDDEEELQTRRMVLQGSHRSLGLQLNTTDGGRSTPMLHNSSSSTYVVSPVSPTTPVDFTSAPTITESRTSFTKNHRGRQISYSSTKSKKTLSVRDQSPSVAASVTAARLAWEAKEEKKERKRENKRRRSEAKDGDRSRAGSKCSTRGRGNSDSTSGTVQESDGFQPSSVDSNVREKVLPENEVYREPGMEQAHGYEEEQPEHAHEESEKQEAFHWRSGGSQRRRKQGVISMEQSTRRRASFKKMWLEFFVRLRIGMVHLRRKIMGKKKHFD